MAEGEVADRHAAPAADGVAAGRVALSEGRWEDARAAFAASLDGEESARALDGMAEALWWLCDGRASVRYRERAFVRFREAGDPAAACRAAIDVSIGHLLHLGNDVAARGWLARAERLVPECESEPGALQGWLRLMQGYTATDAQSAHELTSRALDLARVAGDVDLELVALADLGLALVGEGRVDAGFGLLDEAMAGTLGGECRRRDTVVFASCSMLAACSLAGDLERATQWCRAAEDFMRQFGCPFLRARCRAHYGGVLVAKGRWRQAEAELDAALRMSVDAGVGPRDEALTHLADLRVRQGRLEEAEATLARIADPGAAALATAMLWLGRGQPSAAVGVLTRRLGLLGDRNIGVAPTLAALVDALIRRGDLGSAGDAVGRLEALAGSGEGDRAHTRALALGARARLTAAQGDDDAAAGLFEQALACFAPLQLPLETARLRLELARSLVEREPQLAVAAATVAKASFDQLGASADADAAAALLRRLGARTPPGPRQLGELTRREREVLELVGIGLSNPEIAQRLYISRKTAAHHVSSLLTKLGLRNRAELVAHRARRPPVGGPTG